jgi:uracil-DNA glycosylase
MEEDILSEIRNYLAYQVNIGFKEVLLPDLAPESQLTGLEAIRAELGDCTRCPLHRGRKNIVFGEGNPQARLMFVGEGPGADEDEQGRPFVGKAGQLLTKMIQAMKLEREDVYITNIVKSRPPGNRDPEPEEIAACLPFLEAQIKEISPEVIVALGRISAHTLLNTTEPISVLRGNFRQRGDIAVMPTYHPAFLLRGERQRKAEAWSDLKMVMARLGIAE